MRILPPAAARSKPAPGSLIVDRTRNDIEGIPGFWTDLVRCVIGSHCARTSRTLPMAHGPGAYSVLAEAGCVSTVSRFVRLSSR